MNILKNLGYGVTVLVRQRSSHYSSAVNRRGEAVTRPWCPCVGQPPDLDGVVSTMVIRHILEGGRPTGSPLRGDGIMNILQNPGCGLFARVSYFGHFTG